VTLSDATKQAAGAGSPSAALLEARDVAIQYGGVQALEPLSISVEEGSLTLILGPNGAGKTSFLKALAGAVLPRSGRVLIGGQDVTVVPAHRRVKLGVSLVPEGRGRLPSLSVEDNLQIGWHAAARDRRGDYKREVEKIFELFPVLRQRLDQDCSTLSGGEMQMLAIARGLLAKPSVLLLDEPSLGLAPLAVSRVYEVLSRLNADGLAMVLVEQKAVPLPAKRETTIVLQNGKIRYREASRPTPAQLAALYLGEVRQS
jgi:branched-chain amino acid transport system ATP-binding protein